MLDFITHQFTDERNPDLKETIEAMKKEAYEHPEYSEDKQELFKDVVALLEAFEIAKTRCDKYYVERNEFYDAWNSMRSHICDKVFEKSTIEDYRKFLDCDEKLYFDGTEHHAIEAIVYLYDDGTLKEEET